jgi:hypothetical protein
VVGDYNRIVADREVIACDLNTVIKDAHFPGAEQRRGLESGDIDPAPEASVPIESESYRV